MLIKHQVCLQCLKAFVVVLKCDRCSYTVLMCLFVGCSNSCENNRAQCCILTTARLSARLRTHFIDSCRTTCTKAWLRHQKITAKVNTYTYPQLALAVVLLCDTCVKSDYVTLPLFWSVQWMMNLKASRTNS